MTDDTSSGHAVRITASEIRVAWTATVLLALYSCWVGYVGFRHLPTLVGLHAGLGIEGPLPSVVDLFGSHPWVYLLMFVAIAFALVSKEMIIKDKRRSIMITCLVAVVLLIVVDVSRIMLIEPMYQLFGQLS